MLDRVQGGEYADQSEVWTTFDLGKSCKKQIEKGRVQHRNPVEPCSTPLPVLDGA